MATSRKAQQAVDYIQHTTKQKLEQRDILNAAGDFVVDKQEKDAYRHEVVANQMLKVINTTPGLSKACRQVMSMKIYNPGISDMQVALAMGIREADVKKYETYGKNRCISYMKQVSLEDVTGKFNADRLIEAEVKNLNRAKHNSNPLVAE